MVQIGFFSSLTHQQQTNQQEIMLYFSIYFFFLLQTTTTSVTSPPYTPTDYILLNCGSSTNLPDQSSRNWDGDQSSKYAPFDASALSLALTASSQVSVERVPYMTARVSHSQFTYTFPVLTGPKFLRLYFYPNTYSNYTTTQSFFSVSVNNFTLLKNFSGQFNSPSPSVPLFKKEYLFNVEENQRIDLTFSPNENSFAFINGIEIVSVPDKLYYKGNDIPIKTDTGVTYLHSDTILENLYRLNVGGSHINIQDDTGMVRAWDMDDDYIFGGDFGYSLQENDVPIKYSTDTPNYSAPEIVYTTSRTMSNISRSLRWHFPVDSGFHYLHRFHFCETDWHVTNVNQRVFTIQMDGVTLEIDADVFSWTKGSGIPIYIDYITWVPDYDGSHGKKDLNLSLFPYLEGNPLWSNVLLNGLEIFKMSDMNRSLAAANYHVPSSSGPDSTLTPPKRSGKVVFYVLGSVFGLIALVIIAISLFIFRKDSGSGGMKLTKLVPFSRFTMRTGGSGSGSGSTLPSNLCRHFLLDEMKSATHNFDDNFVIGKGGFGNVYQGYIDNGATRVAIKRLNTSSNQGVHEFLTEITMLSKLRHLHLVSLLGYCDENKEMILVYEYMSNGTLREHLYNSENSSLTWKQRLQICIGAAKGLHYLHTSAKHTIIHRDVKSTNILLNEKWVAKVSDFGLSRFGPTDGLQTHVSTVVKGSFGYLDPEYYRRKQLTEKSDVYSFGVVLLEVLCARPPIMPRLSKDKVNLAEWAKICNKKGTLEETIIDPNIKQDIAPECLKKYVELALMCLRDKGMERPTLSDIVGSLEFAMQLQEAADKRNVDDESSFNPLRKSSFPLLYDGKPFSTDDEEMFTGSTEGGLKSKSSGSLFSSGEVFSEILHPTVR